MYICLSNMVGCALDSKEQISINLSFGKRFGRPVDNVLDVHISQWYELVLIIPLIQPVIPHNWQLCLFVKALISKPIAFQKDFFAKLSIDQHSVCEYALHATVSLQLDPSIRCLFIFDVPIGCTDSSSVSAGFCALKLG